MSVITLGPGDGRIGRTRETDGRERRTVGRRSDGWRRARLVRLVRLDWYVDRLVAFVVEYGFRIVLEFYLTIGIQPRADALISDLRT